MYWHEETPSNNIHGLRVFKYCCVVILAVLSLSLPAFADEEATEPSLFDLSLEEALDIEVVSASRQKQPWKGLSVPVSVITAEDIHYSGLTNLYEILQFAPSIDMLQVNRNRYSMGVRGLHDWTSDRTLILIDGKVAISPLFGGSELTRLPLQLEDIHQIEIVRGPTGAVWGANAFNGAINIITKKPDEVPGVTFSTTVNEFGDNYEFLRWADSDGPWAWRVSTGYEKQTSSSDALDTLFSTASSPSSAFVSRDFRRTGMVDTDFFRTLNDDSVLSFGFGYSDIEMGDFEELTYYPMTDGYMRTGRGYVRREFTDDDGQRFMLQWYGHYEDTFEPSFQEYEAFRNTFEGQWDFAPAEEHTMTVGSSLQLTRIDGTINTDQDFYLVNEPFDEERVNAYVIDRWDVSEKWDVESQLMGEWYSETHTDWAGRISGLYALDDDKDHILRLSTAKSFRTPGASPSRNALSRPGGLQVLPNENLDNEEIVSLEAGYDGKVNDSTTFRINSYYQWYDEMIGFSSLGGNFFQPKNIGRADGYGVEPELSFHNKDYKLTLWYAYNRFSTKEDPPDISETQEVRAYLPANSKAGATLRWFLEKQTTLNVNYKYATTTDGSYGPIGDDIPKYNRVDITLAKAFKAGKVDGEFMVGVSDIFDETELKVGDQGSILYSHETPGRILFTRLQVHF